MDITNYMSKRIGEMESNAISTIQSLAEAQNEIDRLRDGIAKIENELAKIGYQLNEIDGGAYEVIKTEYSADNPVIWLEGMEPVNNQYYRLPDGKVYVWMGEWVEW